MLDRIIYENCYRTNEIVFVIKTMKLSRGQSPRDNFFLNNERVFRKKTGFRVSLGGGVAENGGVFFLFMS
mgnify:CR=1 FL=1